MSKAEKFIDNCTRNCSNLVYKDTINGKEFNTYNEWLTPDQAKKAVEIAREEMIEWFKENAFKYVEKQDTIFGTIKVINSQKLVNVLKQIMKDE